MNNNLNDAPALTQRDIMINNIKKESKKILEKYFDGREYKEDKVNLWKEYALEETNNYLKSSYKDFGFIILILIVNLHECRTNSQGIYRSDSDYYFNESIETKTMFCEIRIFFTKIYISNINHIENIEDKILIKANDIITSILENKKYLNKIAKNNAKEIVEELNRFLMERKISLLPCSYHACYIIKKPMNYKFGYKVINLKYMPLMATYSNDSLYSQIILFILNN